MKLTHIKESQEAQDEYCNCIHLYNSTVLYHCGRLGTIIYHSEMGTRENGSDFSFTRNAANTGRRGLPMIQTKTKATDLEVCHDDSTPPVRAQTIHELHSLQKKKSTPSTPVTTTQGPFATLSEEERQRQQLQSISASLASLTRETGPKVVKGDPATKAETGTHVHHHPQPHYYASTAFDVSDSALKFTHVLCNLSPAELYEQAIKYEKGSFITATVR
ncbi:Phosphoenolpyruvate carboxykinase of ATP [Spatholobus suberectus]|nr:Phosphoenolpyruvate carboxykinase of ATP [Spatholobus suberectus]